jgi:protein SCO1/2
VCRALGSEYQQMQARIAALPRDEGVRLLSVSFDREHDGAPQLQAYARANRADPRLWRVTVPASADGSRALLRALGVVVIPDGRGGFVHNGSIHLLDGNGTLRGVFTIDEWEHALDAARRLAAAGPGAGK